MSKIILVTGSNGLLGQKLVNRLVHREAIKVIATSKGPNRNPLSSEDLLYEPLDLNDEGRWEELMDLYGVDEVINTAAMTNVDACETDREQCRMVNVEAVQLMVNMCQKFGAKLTHVSTDFIFDGLEGPYNEKAVPHPLSFYGQCKFEAERIVMEGAIPFAIIRTVLLYGVVPHMSRTNVILWAKQALEKGQEIRVVNDQFRSPTLAEDLADGILLVSMKNKQGIWHISGPEVMSILDIVRQVAEFWKLDASLIRETDSASLAQAAARPPKTGFLILKAQTELGYKPHTLKEGLAIVARQLGEE